MRILALTISLALLAGCKSFTWEGQNPGISEAQAARGMKDPKTLAAEHSRQLFWAEVRRNMDGRTNALDRDFKNIGTTIDRHFFNYSPDDPYVNFPTDENYWSTTLNRAGSFFGTNVMPWVPAR